MNMVKEKAIQALIGIVLKSLSEQDLKKWVDAGLDLVEDKVESSPSPWDNRIILPVCDMIRTTFQIEDNDA